MRGKGEKIKRRINSEKEHDIINETVIKYNYEQKMTLSVPKIN